MKMTVDLDRGIVESAGVTHQLGSAEGFALVSKAWLRAGWDAKYVYSFTWLGRPIIQLPEDMVRLQELIFQTKPDVIVETGVAHGGSLVFYASLFEAMGHGRVIGVDIEIRKHNRDAIESHPLSKRIKLIEGSSTTDDVVAQVRKDTAEQVVLVLLDSSHTRAHVLDELNAYASVVSVGSYVVAMDGIMRDVAGAPRTAPTWVDDNPISAVHDFLASRNDFALEDPPFGFNEGSVRERVTYWPSAFLRRIR